MGSGHYTGWSSTPSSRVVAYTHALHNCIAAADPSPRGGAALRRAGGWRTTCASSIETRLLVSFPSIRKSTRLPVFSPVFRIPASRLFVFPTRLPVLRSLCRVAGVSDPSLVNSYLVSSASRHLEVSRASRGVSGRLG